jgi:ribosomal protein S27AE
MSYTCPHCGATSHNPNDERERYCGRCHLYASDIEALQEDPG